MKYFIIISHTHDHKNILLKKEDKDGIVVLEKIDDLKEISSAEVASISHTKVTLDKNKISYLCINYDSFIKNPVTPKNLLDGFEIIANSDEDLKEKIATKIKEIFSSESYREDGSAIVYEGNNWKNINDIIKDVNNGICHVSKNRYKFMNLKYNKPMNPFYAHSLYISINGKKHKLPYYLFILDKGIFDKELEKKLDNVDELKNIIFKETLLYNDYNNLFNIDKARKLYENNKIFEILVKKNDDLNVAVLASNVDTISNILLYDEVCVNRLDVYGYHILSYVKDIKTVEELMRYGVSINSVNYDGTSYLKFQIPNKNSHDANLELFEYFLRKGANPNSMAENNLSLLHKAIIENQYEIVELLLRFGADYSVCNNQGDNALKIAIYNNHKDIISLLVDYGSKLSA